MTEIYDNIIQHNNELYEFCQKIQNEEQFITVDTEFIREDSYYPHLCLIQIGTSEKACVIDPLMELDLTPFFEILKNPNIVKVFHAARQDLEIFYSLLNGELPVSIFDTQVAAMVCGYGDSIGYEPLVKDILKIKIDKSCQHSNWAQRPLSKEQIEYALTDVIHLRKIYQMLSERLTKNNRHDWIVHEMDILTNPDNYKNTPEEAWKRLKFRRYDSKYLTILKGLAAWRETKAQQNNIPKSRIIKDDVLLDLAQRAPENAKAFKAIKGSRQWVKAEDVDDITAVIQESKKNELPLGLDVKKPLIVPGYAVAQLELLKILLRSVCEHHHVTSKIVAQQLELDYLVFYQELPESMASGWRYEIFGQKALSIVKGELAFAVGKNKVAFFDVSSLEGEEKGKHITQGEGSIMNKNSLPEGFVYLDDIDPTIEQHIMYAMDDNFIGRPLVGYQKPRCIMTKKAAEALSKVQEKLQKLGYSLRVYDSYRPVKTVQFFIEWANDLEDQKMKDRYYPNIDKAQVFDLGYIAKRSTHSRGSTVDLTISGFDMGTILDFMDEKSHHDNPSIKGMAFENRQLLRRLMREGGFKEYTKEWWHYTLENEPFPDTYFDFDVM